VSAALYDDAELYDLHHDGYRDDFGFYRRLAIDGGGAVLELGAGTGRLTLHLARSGIDVVAVEPHPAMRSRLERHIVEAGLGARVEVVAGDARTLDLGVAVPLVIAPFNTLMHLESLADQDAALASARRHLRAGGAFASDLFVPRFRPDGAVHGERRVAFGASVGLDAGDAADIILWQEHDEVGQVLTTHVRLDASDPHGVVRRRAAVLRQRYWRRFELERALATAGFSDVRVYGDFDRGPLTPASTVMAAVARP
jgi:SAM-dependent methyltransferase